MWAAILAFLGGLLKIFIQTPPAVAVEGQKLGQAQTTATVDTQTAQTEAGIATAEANAPTTQAGVVDELNKGRF